MTTNYEAKVREPHASQGNLIDQLRQKVRTEAAKTRTFAIINSSSVLKPAAVTPFEAPEDSSAAAELTQSTNMNNNVSKEGNLSDIITMATGADPTSSSSSSVTPGHIRGIDSARGTGIGTGTGIACAADIMSKWDSILSEFDETQIISAGGDLPSVEK